MPPFKNLFKAILDKINVLDGDMCLKLHDITESIAKSLSKKTEGRYSKYLANVVSFENFEASLKI